MHRFLAVLLLLTLLPGCSGSLTRVPEGERIVRLHKEFPGMTETAIFSATQRWMEDNFTVLKDPISLVVPEEGRVVGRSQIPYPCSMLSCINKNGWLVVFEMQVDASDGVMQTVFRRLALTSPPSVADPDYDSGLLSPVWLERDLNAIRPQLVLLNEELAQAVRTSSP
jgi:hypothetical protein